MRKMALGKIRKTNWCYVQSSQIICMGHRKIVGNERFEANTNSSTERESCYPRIPFWLFTFNGNSVRYVN